MEIQNSNRSYIVKFQPLQIPHHQTLFCGCRNGFNSSNPPAGSAPQKFPHLSKLDPSANRFRRFEEREETLWLAMAPAIFGNWNEIQGRCGFHIHHGAAWVVSCFRSSASIRIAKILSAALPSHFSGTESLRFNVICLEMAF